MHLDVPAGTAVRFEPGEGKEVTLAEFGGSGELVGLNNLTDSSHHSEANKQAALGRARERGCGLVQLTSDKARPDAIRFYEQLGFTASHEGMKLKL